VDRATRDMMPYVYMMCVGLLVVILVPWVTLVLPRILKLG
jgi:TRAP-type C4-dicarboxylate transport system permease large subunit